MTEGKITIAPEVLHSIARLTCLNVPGVSQLFTLPPTVNRLLKKNAREGVQIEIEDDIVMIDIHVVMEKDTNIREVSKTIQQDVTRAISEMVGMQVGRVNIHVEDISYPVAIEA